MEATQTRRRSWWRAPTAAAEDRALTRSTLPSVMFPAVAGQPVTTGTALQQADVWACVRALANAGATLPLHLFERRGDGGRVRFHGPPAPLFERPSPSVYQAAFIGTTIAHLATYGNAFVGLYRGEEGAVEQLAPLMPEYVIVRVEGGIPFYDYTGTDGRIQTLTERDVLHVRTLSLDGIIGRSPIAACRAAVGANAALASYQSHLLENFAAPAGVLSIPTGPGADDQMEELRKAWKARHGGPERAGSVAVLQGDVTFSPVGQSLADLQFVALRESSTREICRMFGVPVWIIGAEPGGSLTYSTTRDQRQALLDFGASPFLVAIEQAFNLRDDLMPPGVYAEFERGAWLEGDPIALADALARQVAAKLLTVNEARAMLNRPALSDAELAALAPAPAVATPGGAQ